MNISSNEASKQPPFEGFSLERSTSFSEGNDSYRNDPSSFEACKVVPGAVNNASLLLRQKHLKANYEEAQLAWMEKTGHSPLERKPFVFKQGEKVISCDEHIRTINQKS